MTKIAVLALTSVLLSGCVVEPHIYAPFPYDTAYNLPLVPYPRERLRRAPRAVELEDLGQRDDGAAPSDPTPEDTDGVMRSPDEEEVIGGDDPPPDPSLRRSRPQPSIERHRDHSGDYQR